MSNVFYKHCEAQAMPDKSKLRGASFNIPSNRLLVKTLGEYDALVEYQEVANRLMLNEQESSKEPFRDYLARVSKDVKINLNDITLQDYKSAIIQGYLVFPNASFDDFLDGFVDDVRILIDDQFNIGKNKKGCNFEKIVDALKDITITLTIDQDKVNLYHYYRLLRNDLAHRLNKEYTKEFNTIDKNAIKAHYPTLLGPNQKSSLCFDDFILCTANIKSIAFEMTKSLLPYIKWKDVILANKEMWIPKYKRFLMENRIKRLHTYINTTLFNIYGVELEEYDLISISGSLE